MTKLEILAAQQALAQEFAARTSAFNQQMGAVISGIAAGFVAISAMSALQADYLKQTGRTVRGARRGARAARRPCLWSRAVHSGAVGGVMKNHKPSAAPAPAPPLVYLQRAQDCRGPLAVQRQQVKNSTWIPVAVRIELI
jgi:hypothetical protein